MAKTEAVGTGGNPLLERTYWAVDDAATSTCWRTLFPTERSDSKIAKTVIIIRRTFKRVDQHSLWLVDTTRRLHRVYSLGHVRLREIVKDELEGTTGEDSNEVVRRKMSGQSSDVKT